MCQDDGCDSLLQMKPVEGSTLLRRRLRRSQRSVTGEENPGFCLERSPLSRQQTSAAAADQRLRTPLRNESISQPIESDTSSAESISSTSSEASNASLSLLEHTAQTHCPSSGRNLSTRSCARIPDRQAEGACRQDAAAEAVLEGLRRCGFYHGAVGRSAAEQLLRREPEGSFLLRDSSDRRALLAVSVSTGAGVTSIRVMGEPGRYQLDSHYSTTPLPCFASPLLLLAYLSVLSGSSDAARYAWLDAAGRKHAAVHLRFPLYREVPRPATLRVWADARRQAELMLAGTSQPRSP